jgi:hypothetical protein
MKENIKIVTLNYLLSIYTEEQLLILLNENVEINTLLNSIVLQNFNNEMSVIKFGIKEGFIDYTIGSNYQISLSETLTKIFLQLDDTTILGIMLSTKEKLNK